MISIPQNEPTDSGNLPIPLKFVKNRRRNLNPVIETSTPAFLTNIMFNNNIINDGSSSYIQDNQEIQDVTIDNTLGNSNNTDGNIEENGNIENNNCIHETNLKRMRLNETEVNHDNEEPNQIDHFLIMNEHENTMNIENSTGLNAVEKQVSNKTLLTFKHVIRMSSTFYVCRNTVFRAHG